MANCFSAGLVSPSAAASVYAALGVPVIDDEPLDHPHRAGAIAGGAVNVRGLVARRGDGREELVGDRRIRRLRR